MITSGSSIAVAQLSLPKGTYILTGFVRFPKNSNGVRRANFHDLSGSTTIQTLVKANGENYDQLN